MLVDGRKERIDDELYAVIRQHRESYNSPRKEIHHRTEIEFGTAPVDVREVRDPDVVRSLQLCFHEQVLHHVLTRPKAISYCLIIGFHGHFTESSTDIIVTPPKYHHDFSSISMA